VRTDSMPLTLSVVPAYPTFPPEMVYPRTPRTSEPAAIFREAGSSRIAFFPGDVDRTCWRSGNTDLSQLLQNAIHWVQGAEAPIASVNGDGVIELFAWETERGYALHLLNYTNPNMTRGYVRRFYPVGPQQVRFRVGGRRITNIQALRSGRSIQFLQEAGTISFETPTVEDYEVLAIV